jgi:hypothetical protein
MNRLRPLRCARASDRHGISLPSQLPRSNIYFTLPTDDCFTLTLLHLYKLPYSQIGYDL